MKLQSEEAGGSSSAAREVRLVDGGATIDGRLVPAVVRRLGGPAASIEIGREILGVRVARAGERAFVWCDGRTFTFRRAAGRAVPGAARSAAPSAGLLSPMPGRVRKVHVAEGDHVARGQVLLVLEAMKMEHAIRSPRDGRVMRLPFREGDLVEAGVALAEILSEEKTAEDPSSPAA